MSEGPGRRRSGGERGHDGHDDDDNAGDPAAAFEALQATVEGLAVDLAREMVTIRKGVEASFDQFERQAPPVDYSADLGRIVHSLAGVGERLKAVEQSPLLRQGPEHHARMLTNSGEGLVRTAAQQLQRQTAELERTARQLTARMKEAHEREEQNTRMWMAAAVGLIIGAFLVLILPRFLPFAADSHVASLVMGRDRVGAAYAMIGAADPFSIEKIRWSFRFFDGGGREFSACLTKARETGEEQTCTITVPAPRQ